tara:strand:- start:7 stop:216 length:210 start_codon:yes stop_codon:yes gene_type:complete
MRSSQDFSKPTIHIRKDWEGCDKLAEEVRFLPVIVDVGTGADIWIEPLEVSMDGVGSVICYLVLVCLRC